MVAIAPYGLRFGLGELVGGMHSAAKDRTVARFMAQATWWRLRPTGELCCSWFETICAFAQIPHHEVELSNKYEFLILRDAAISMAALSRRMR